MSPNDSVLIYVWRKVTADWVAKQLRPYVKGTLSSVAIAPNRLKEARIAAI